MLPGICNFHRLDHAAAGVRRRIHGRGVDAQLQLLHPEHLAVQRPAFVRCAVVDGRYEPVRFHACIHERLHHRVPHDEAHHHIVVARKSALRRFLYLAELPCPLPPQNSLHRFAVHGKFFSLG